jgi:hypothetical protein
MKIGGVNSMKKQIISIIVCIAFVFTILPIPVYAAEDSQEFYNESNAESSHETISDENQTNNDATYDNEVNSINPNNNNTDPSNPDNSNFNDINLNNSNSAPSTEQSENSTKNDEGYTENVTNEITEELPLLQNFAQLQSLQEIVSSSVEGSFTILGGIEGINYTYNGAEVVIKNGADLTIFNTNSDTEIFDTNTSIIIANNANAKLTLAGVRISLNSNSPIAVRDGAQLTLTLQENTVNQLISNNSGCGIEVAGTATLIIEGEGSLICNGAMYYAGIGGAYMNNAGIIKIKSGIVTATAGNFAAGIGGAPYGTVDTIEIYGGTIAANGGLYAAGIGSGYPVEGGTIRISGGDITATGSMGSAIGGSCNNVAGNIEITGGKVNAKNTGYGSAIGAGYLGSGGTIIISGEDTEVTADSTIDKSNRSVAIGDDQSPSTTSILIDNAKQVKALSNLGKKAFSVEPTTTGMILISGHPTDPTCILEKGSVDSVQITPINAEVVYGDSKLFGASVSGTMNVPQTVTWELAGNSSIDTTIVNGLLTVSSTEAATSLSITARSTADSSIFAPATVTLVEPFYDIALSNEESYTFTEKIVGYEEQTPFMVTISNRSNTATGPIELSLSGKDSSDFTINKTTITDILVGEEDSFTIKPNLGLEVGTYHATITIGNSNLTSKSFDISFNVLARPVYDITLSQEETYVFGNVVEGYDKISPLTVEVNNAGNQDIASLQLIVQGTDAEYYTISKDSITDLNVGSSSQFTIGPKAGLTP